MFIGFAILFRNSLKVRVKSLGLNQRAVFGIASFHLWKGAPFLEIVLTQSTRRLSIFETAIFSMILLSILLPLPPNASESKNQLFDIEQCSFAAAHPNGVNKILFIRKILTFNALSRMAQPL